MPTRVIMKLDQLLPLLREGLADLDDGNGHFARRSWFHHALWNAVNRLEQLERLSKGAVEAMSTEELVMRSILEEGKRHEVESKTITGRIRKPFNPPFHQQPGRGSEVARKIIAAFRKHQHGEEEVIITLNGALLRMTDRKFKDYLVSTIQKDGADAVADVDELKKAGAVELAQTTDLNDASLPVLLANASVRKPRKKSGGRKKKATSKS